ncbi:hypothetical protein ACFWBV_01625 [Streptomyces sp. NPDC060030]|uniref:hypothetical protein n=1 Tax=Streptomyces sp. NPDC060030 TaxID=3347042 RepID=UPI0036B00465
MRNDISRRAVVTSAAVIGAAAAVGSFVPGTAAAATGVRTKKAPVSPNGWPIEKEANHVSTVWTRRVAGTGLEVELRIGDVEAVLIHVIRRFHYEVEQLHTVDLAGWRQAGTLRKGLPESNLASGTAVRIRPGAAAKGGLFPQQEIVLRDILADCEGVVRWGGDDSEVDESLFYIDAGPDDERVAALGERFRDWDTTPGLGAGTAVDVRSSSRWSRAERLAGVQRRA